MFRTAALSLCSVVVLGVPAFAAPWGAPAMYALEKSAPRNDSKAATH